MDTTVATATATATATDTDTAAVKPMAFATFDAFEADAKAHGFDEVLVREWAPGQQLATHAHPFAVQALVVRGEFALTCGGHTRRIVAGGGFELARDVPHAEHYGPQGATVWVARRHEPVA